MPHSAEHKRWRGTRLPQLRSDLNCELKRPETHSSQDTGTQKKPSQARTLNPGRVQKGERQL